MMNCARKYRFFTGSAVTLSLLSATPAFSGGYEKATMWSGHWAGLVGAASAPVTGAESLYFNPAGLASEPNALQFSLNVSPTFSKFSGPFTAANQVIYSNRSFTPPFGAVASYAVDEKLGVGIGVYTSGGTKAVFEDVSFSNLGAGYANLSPDFKSELSVIEASLGAGYEVMDGLRLGASWRVAFVSAELATASLSQTTTALTAIAISDISATRWNGFKLGAQYAPRDAGWGIGADWRTEIGFTGKGTVSASTVVPAVGLTTPVALTAGDAYVSSVFPQQLSLGGFYDFVPKSFRGFLQYTFTEYTKAKTLAIQGSVRAPAALGGATTPIPGVAQNWKNQSNLRVAGEYMLNEGLALRGGYVLTTAVTPLGAARPTFSSPGIGNTFSLGAGASVMPTLRVDGALEYSFASGTVTAADIPAGSTTLPGEYKSNAYVAHLGVTYSL